MKLIRMLILVFGLALFPVLGSGVDSGPIFEESEDLYWPSFDFNHLKGIDINSRIPSSLEEYKSIDELRELIDVCWYRCHFIQDQRFKLLDRIHKDHPEID